MVCALSTLPTPCLPPSLGAAVSLPPRPPHRRSISVPGPPALAMADTYAVVQKRGALAGPGPGSGARGTEEAPLYSQVAPRARRPQAPAEDARGAPPSRGELRPGGARGWGVRRPPAPAGVGKALAATRTPAHRCGLVMP